VTQAVKAYQEGTVKKIILVRPAVEAGEKIGYLPGDMLEKISPYMLPLYDSLNEILGKEKVKGLIDTGAIEIATLGFMRGRTLKEAFIIADEMQNATHAQMKMLLTRIGEGSKTVITGDLKQIDLPKASQSGLERALDLLSNIRGIEVVQFDQSEVLRHRLVREIVSAYEGVDA
jgi:phosphate starvation-inducible protein PhoH and related proteins